MEGAHWCPCLVRSGLGNCNAGRSCISWVVAATSQATRCQARAD